MKNIALFVVLCAVTVLVATGCSPKTEAPATADTNAPSTTATNK